MCQTGQLTCWVSGFQKNKIRLYRFAAVNVLNGTKTEQMKQQSAQIKKILSRAHRTRQLPFPGTFSVYRFFIAIFRMLSLCNLFTCMARLLSIVIFNRLSDLWFIPTALRWSCALCWTKNWTRPLDLLIM